MKLLSYKNRCDSQFDKKPLPLKTTAAPAPISRRSFFFPHAGHFFRVLQISIDRAQTYDRMHHTRNRKLARCVSPVPNNSKAIKLMIYLNKQLHWCNLRAGTRRNDYHAGAYNAIMKCVANGRFIGDGTRSVLCTRLLRNRLVMFGSKGAPKAGICFT